MKNYLIIFFVGFFCQPVFAQTCCSAGAPISSSFDIAASNTKALAFQLAYEYNSVNLLIDNNERLINDPRKRNGQTVLFKTDFSLNKHWAFSAFIPYVIQSRNTFSAMENAKGLGDVTVLGQYANPVSEQYVLKLSAGIKLPTGRQYINDDRGINLSPDMQSGSGTFDFIGRLALVGQHVFIPNLSFQAAASYRYNNTNEHFGDPERINGRQFKFGNETQITTAFSYLITSWAWFVRPEFGLQLRHTDPNQEENFEASNSGGLWLKIPIALQFMPGNNFSFRLFGEIPIKQYLKGLQISTNYRLGIQFRYAFSLAEEPTILIH